jgi:hypothetical protein
VIADTHYGSADTRRTLADHGTELVAPAMRSSSPKRLYSKDDFIFDLDAGTVTCQAGHTVIILARPADRRFQLPFPTALSSRTQDRTSQARQSKIPWRGLLKANSLAELRAGAARSRSAPFITEFRRIVFK